MMSIEIKINGETINTIGCIRRKPKKVNRCSICEYEIFYIGPFKQALYTGEIIKHRHGDGALSLAKELVKHWRKDAVVNWYIEHGMFYPMPPINKLLSSNGRTSDFE